ncbi:DUF2624 family protein [Alkalibacillus aidingensis]|uniref:DUF2624 family protein n=1 Tax=Alkalibacillus aidingensis TaxID=2747607 RepID=UPI0016603742|nr:DUF2624 family protein [Alkalibacillus aidingensis]
MLKQLITTRLYNATPNEVVSYSHEYQVPINHKQATMLLDFIKQNKIDPFSEKDRLKTFKYIEQKIGSQEAKQASELLYRLAKQYNVDDWL